VVEEIRLRPEIFDLVRAIAEAVDGTRAEVERALLRVGLDDLTYDPERFLSELERERTNRPFETVGQLDLDALRGHED
jgi:hypothetical protein